MATPDERIRKSREFTRDFEGLELRLRRPSVREFAQLEREQWDVFRVADAFVVGWEGVSEADLWPGGGEDAVAFSTAVWQEYLADREHLWEPVAQAIAESFSAFLDKREGRKKNS